MRADRRLAVAPTTRRPRTLERVDREAMHARDGRGGRILTRMTAIDLTRMSRRVRRRRVLAAAVGVAIAGHTAMHLGAQPAPAFPNPTMRLSPTRARRGAHGT